MRPQTGNPAFKYTKYNPYKYLMTLSVCNQDLKITYIHKIIKNRWTTCSERSSSLHRSYKCSLLLLLLLLFLCCPFFQRIHSVSEESRAALSLLLSFSFSFSAAFLHHWLMCLDVCLHLTDSDTLWTRSWPQPSYVSCWAGGCSKCRDLWFSPGRSPHASLLKHWSSPPVSDMAQDQIFKV